MEGEGTCAPNRRFHEPPLVVALLANDSNHFFNSHIDMFLSAKAFQNPCIELIGVTYPLLGNEAFI